VDLRPVFYILGILLIILAGSMTLPLLVDIYTNSDDWKVFFLCMIITTFFGGAFMLSNADHTRKLSVRQAFLLTALSWIFIGAFAALPFYLSALKLNYTDAFFEAMSGITTTGVTVITDLEQAPHGILLWRGMLAVLGGLGFIVMGMSLLPMLKIGGMRLFRTESSEKEKALPRAAQLANTIALVYVALIGIGTVCFVVAGLNFFDALLHAMGSLATAGFSNYDASIGALNNVWAEIITIVFMIIGSTPFVLYIRAFKGDFRALIEDRQVHCFLLLILACTAIMTLYLALNNGVYLPEALLRAGFSVTAILTTTGYVSEDYSLWGPLAVAMFFFMAAIGGCSGSTTGGIKIFRLQVLFEVVNVQIKKLLYPHAVFLPHFNGRPISSDITLSVMGFFFMYVVTFVLGTVAVAATGQDFLTASSAVIACLSNTGVGMGPVVGPSGTYASLPDNTKWILSTIMLMGRLELFTILVFLSPHFWRH
jgi:trk system potassium uptake protein TrkH